MKKQSRHWKRITKLLQTLSNRVQCWYAYAKSDTEERQALAYFASDHARFLNSPQPKPHHCSGYSTDAFKQARYLSFLPRRSPAEEKKYRESLKLLKNLDIHSDLLELAFALYNEYKDVVSTPPPQSFFTEEGRQNIFADARRCLSGLSNDKRKDIKERDAMEHTTALIAYLVESKLRLDCALQADKQSEGNPLRICVIVPAHNEEKRLKLLSEDLAGEDLVTAKITELAFLLGGINQEIKINLRFMCDNPEIKESINQAIDKVKKDDIVKRYLSTNDSLDFETVLSTPGYDGNTKAFNVWEGLKGATIDQFELIGYTDADRSSNLGLLGLLIYAIKVNGYIAAIGSRGQSESWVYGRDPFRTQESKVYNFLVRLLLGVDYRDTQAGLKLFDNKSIAEIIADINELDDKSMAFDSEILCRIDRKYREQGNHPAISEVPIVWFESALESQSASAQVIIEMLIGVFIQGKAFYQRTEKSNISSLTDFHKLFQEESLRADLLCLGTDKNLSALLRFAGRFYNQIEPDCLRDLSKAIRELLIAITSNELTQDEIEMVVQRIRETWGFFQTGRFVEYLLNVYPQLQRLIHHGFWEPRLINPMLCFLLGGEAVSRFWPNTPRQTKSFSALLYELHNPTNGNPPPGTLLSAYDQWLKHIEQAKNIRTEPVAPRLTTTTTERGRRAAARKLLESGDFNIYLLHVVIPVMGARVHKKNANDDFPQMIKNAVEGTRIELAYFADKLAHFTKILPEDNNSPNLKYNFYITTGLTKNKFEEFNNDEGIKQQLQRLAEFNNRFFNIYICTINEDDPKIIEVQTIKDNSWKEVPFIYPDRNLNKEIEGKRLPKGTLLLMGFTVAKYYATDNDGEENRKHLLGYTVTTSKIPFEEFVFLARDAAQLSNEPLLVVGTRRDIYSEVTNKPLLNHARSAILNLVVRALFPDLGAISDTQASCKLMTLDLAKKLLNPAQGEPQLRAIGLAVDVELIQLARYHAAKVKLTPISFYEGAGTRDELGVGTGLDLITEFLELKKELPNVASRPRDVEEQGLQYRVSFLNSGTEHMVFLLKRNDNGDKPLVVKIPHEAVDHALYLPADSLCVNVLQHLGWTPPTDRITQHRLVTNFDLVRSLLAARGRTLAEWINSLRSWTEFNSITLKLIRAFEQKTFKSTGYSLAANATEYVVDFGSIPKDKYVKIRISTDRENTPIDWYFTRQDQVFVQEFLPDNLDKYLYDESLKFSGLDKGKEVTEMFKRCISGSHDFLCEMAEKARLFDIDTNIWSDLALTCRNGKLRFKLLDPGEIISLNDSKIVLEILKQRLEIKEGEKSISETIEQLDYSKAYNESSRIPIFQPFQFRQLELFMEKYELKDSEREEVRKQLTCSIKKYLSLIFNTVNNPNQEIQSVNNEETDPNKWWCCLPLKNPNGQTNLDITENNKNRYSAQEAAIMFGATDQGRYGDKSNYRAPILAYRGLRMRDRLKKEHQQ